ncbi:ribokinase [Devosia sp. WQ 349]|uniref:carbohydrate kinase family protein n=1 Tax=Devosia sp. WQ 349K1 TaxID=2800329 RepID=UPI001908B17E|nr:PfkB family carbohydrate kinase [Devosia sp. WQ 349K1]MBK1795428.1 ribokinase [Devosia sp. WQ 349K1]
MSLKVLVVGDVMTDIIVKPEGPIVWGSDRRAKIRNRPGGSGANQAVWLGAAGVPVKFVARVGQDDLATHERYFARFGVDAHLAGDAEFDSGILVTVLDQNGERSFLTDRGANLNLCSDDMPETVLDEVGLVLISGYSLFSPGPRQAARRLLDQARARQIPIAVDPASVGFLAEIGPSQFMAWVGSCDWIFANDSEAEVLTGHADFEQQIAILAKTFRNVVIKRGRFGAVLGGTEGIVLSLPAPVVPVVDTTGAGDAFAAGFVGALLAGADAATCLGAGIAGGAKAVQFVGGQPQ